MINSLAKYIPSRGKNCEGDTLCLAKLSSSTPMLNTFEYHKIKYLKNIEELTPL